MNWRFLAVVIPIWCALSVICGLSWGAVGWLVRALRQHRINQARERVDQDAWDHAMEDGAERQRKALDAIMLRSHR
jgi:hypothetical protein